MNWLCCMILTDKQALKQLTESELPQSTERALRECLATSKTFSKEMKKDIIRFNKKLHVLDHLLTLFLTIL